MDTALILESVKRFVKTDKKDNELFLSFLREIKVKRKQFLLKEGEICRDSIFVVKGCMRSYSIDRNGFVHILQFAPRGWWIADVGSLITSQPAKLNIDCLEDTEALLLSREDQMKLFEKAPKFERFFRVLMENSLAAIHHRLLDWMGLSATERYEIFTQRYPDLNQKLPQKQIASYLGVTPEFLSKMKAELLKRKNV